MKAFSSIGIFWLWSIIFSSASLADTVALPGSRRILDTSFRSKQPELGRIPATRELWLPPLTEQRLSGAQRAQALGADLIDAILRIEGMFDPTRIGLFGRALRMEVRAGVASMDNVFGDHWRLVYDDPNVHYRVRYLAQAWLWAPEPSCRNFKHYRPDDSLIVFDAMSDVDCSQIVIAVKRRDSYHLRQIAGGPLSLPVFAAPYPGGRLSLAELRAAQLARVSAIRERLLLKLRVGYQSRISAPRSADVAP